MSGSKLRELEKRLEKEPENLGLRVMVAGAMREAGRQVDAVELYRSVAIAYRDAGRSQQAIAVCRSILEIAPDDVRCHALLASLELGVAAVPATVKAGVSVPLPRRDTKPPASRSSNDETPLPVPMPYHVADPTTKSLKKMSEVDMLPTPDPDDAGEETQPRPGLGDNRGVKGIANAARRISSALVTPADDLAAELDTRQRPRIESDELAKIAHPPPTVPVERLEIIDDDDLKTAPPSITRNLRARAGDADTEEEDEGVPTLNDEEQDEPTRPRDTPIDLMIRIANEGPLGSAFFQPLPPDKRDAVLARFHRKSVKKGTTVIRQGEVGHSLVVVAKGQLGARVDRKGGPLELDVIGTGEFVGEGSLLSRTPSPVQIVAATDCELLLLTPRDFYEIAGAFPALWAELKDVAERRKRERETQLKR